MKNILLIFSLLFVVTACDDESSNERAFPPSQGGSQSGNVDLKVPPTPSIDLAGLKSLPRTLTVTLALDNRNPQNTQVSVVNSNFSEAQPTAFLPKERSDFLFEMRDVRDEILFSGGIRNPLKVTDESVMASRAWPSSGRQGIATFAGGELAKTTIQVRLPVRAGAEKLVVTRLAPVKRQLVVIDLVPLMRRAAGR